jgi:hypothetical protein
MFGLKVGAPAAEPWERGRGRRGRGLSKTLRLPVYRPVCDAGKNGEAQAQRAHSRARGPGAVIPRIYPHCAVRSGTPKLLERKTPARTVLLWHRRGAQRSFKYARSIKRHCFRHRFGSIQKHAFCPLSLPGQGFFPVACSTSARELVTSAVTIAAGARLNFRHLAARDADACVFQVTAPSSR